MAKEGPKPLSEAVSRQLARMPRRDTRPELALRRELHRRGLRYRVNVATLPGSPDIVLSRAKIAVFVDGCFWHGCPDHAVAPKNNAEWWKAKLAANRDRDRRKDAHLIDDGWLPFHVWEHEAASSAAEQIVALWRARIEQ